MMDVALTNALDILEGKPCRNIVNQNGITNINEWEGKKENGGRYSKDIERQT